MTNCKKSTGFLLSWLCSLFFTQAFAQTGTTIRGRITDTANHPLPFCTITVVEDGRTTASQSDGTFAVAFPAEYPAITLRISYVGKSKAWVISWPG